MIEKLKLVESIGKQLGFDVVKVGRGSIARVDVNANNVCTIGKGERTIRSTQTMAKPCFIYPPDNIKVVGTSTLDLKHHFRSILNSFKRTYHVINMKIMLELNEQLVWENAHVSRRYPATAVRQGG